MWFTGLQSPTTLNAIQEHSAMYLQNKYTLWYNQIIFAAQTRETLLCDYIESHHIIPKSLGGTNDPDNLVQLTSREHFVCHLLLTKMVTGKAKRSMSYALWGMVNQKNKWQARHQIKSSKLYEYAKTLANQSLSTERKGKTLEERFGEEKASEIRLRFAQRKPRSSPNDEERSKIAKSVSESWKRQVKPRGFLIKHSCPVCGRTLDQGNYVKSGHGPNCKRSSK